MIVNSSLEQQILILKMKSIAIISQYLQMICISIPPLRTLRWCFTVVTRTSSESPVEGTCSEFSYGYWHSCLCECRNCDFMKCTSDAFGTFCCLYSDAVSTCYGLHSDTFHTFCCLYNSVFINLTKVAANSNSVDAIDEHQFLL
jgi:hypothetical protein